MPEIKKFFRTNVSFEVLSAEPIPDAMELDTILVECNEGEYLLVPPSTKVEAKEITAAEMAKATKFAYSDPSFFNLDSEGNYVGD